MKKKGRILAIFAVIGMALALAAQFLWRLLRRAPGPVGPEPTLPVKSPAEHEVSYEEEKAEVEKRIAKRIKEVEKMSDSQVVDEFTKRFGGGR